MHKFIIPIITLILLAMMVDVFASSVKIGIINNISMAGKEIGNNHPLESTVSKLKSNVLLKNFNDSYFHAELGKKMATYFSSRVAQVEVLNNLPKKYHRINLPLEEYVGLGLDRKLDYIVINSSWGNKEIPVGNRKYIRFEDFGIFYNEGKMEAFLSASSTLIDVKNRQKRVFFQRTVTQKVDRKRPLTQNEIELLVKYKNSSGISKSSQLSENDIPRDRPLNNSEKKKILDGVYGDFDIDKKIEYLTNPTFCNLGEFSEQPKKIKEEVWRDLVNTYMKTYNTAPTKYYKAIEWIKREIESQNEAGDDY